MPPNDPKLSDCGARRGGCMVVARGWWKQPPCGLLGICDRRWSFPIPTLSLHRRKIRGAPASPKTLGEHVRLNRIDMGLTIVQVADLLGVVWQTVERWEHNRTTISPK